MTEDEARLREAIKKLLPKIEKFRKQEINEETTKNAMIAPLLQALGWDVANPDDVRSEDKGKTKKYNPVDYVLRVQGEIKLVIEAKRLGADLKAAKGYTEALANATVIGGAEWCVLTDGNEYRIYKINVAVDADEKLFHTVRISDEKADTIDTLSLLSKHNMAGNRPIDDLWDVQFVDKRVKKAIRAILDPTDENHKKFASLIRKKLKELGRKEIIASLARLEVRFDSPRLTEPKIVPADVAKSEEEKKGNNNHEFFKSIFASRDSIPMSEMIDKLVANGLKKSSATSYISRSQRPLVGTSSVAGNPFGFQTVVATDADGNKILRKV